VLGCCCCCCWRTGWAKALPGWNPGPGNCGGEALPFWDVCASCISTVSFLTPCAWLWD
jgi:hypothetical protein